MVVRLQVAITRCATGRRAMRLGRWHDRAWQWIAGPDGVRPGLPCAELLAPLPLGAIAVVACNDWWWKPQATLPGWLTGKLSDLAGVIALPLVLTAALALGLRLAARLGARVDWTLRPWKLIAAIAATATILIAAKLSPEVGRALARPLGPDAHIVADPTDLLALPVLGLAWWHGRRAIARVPYGRIAWLRSAGRPAAAELDDVRRAGASTTQVAHLVTAIEDDDAAAIERALRALRAGPSAPTEIDER